jgi:predicted amidohydrolase YtcJ
VYVEGIAASARPLRIDAYLHAPVEAFETLRESTDPAGQARRAAMGIKIFADGSLGGRTAALNEHYADNDGTGSCWSTRKRCAPSWRPDALRSIACAVHAIGDRALRTVLDAMGAVIARYHRALALSQSNMRRSSVTRR